MMTSKPCEKDTPDEFKKCFNDIKSSEEDFITAEDLVSLSEDNLPNNSTGDELLTLKEA